MIPTIALAIALTAPDLVLQDQDGSYFVRVFQVDGQPGSEWSCDIDRAARFRSHWPRASLTCAKNLAECVGQRQCKWIKHVRNSRVDDSPGQPES